MVITRDKLKKLFKNKIKNCINDNNDEEVKDNDKDNDKDIDNICNNKRKWVYKNSGLRKRSFNAVLKIVKAAST